MRDYEAILDGLREESRYRTLPENHAGGMIDFSSNDYLGISFHREMVDDFFNSCNCRKMSASASRLLASSQDEYFELESWLSQAYHKDVLLFNSGYHANVGAVSALALSDTLIVADKLVHASIIDGIVLSKSPFKRFRHNDMAQLREIVSENYNKYKQLLVVTESIFSMDGDETNLAELVKIKKDYPSILLYVDEAHALGVRGTKGLGVAEEKMLTEHIDILIGTFGKACCSTGAFVATSPAIKKYLINSSRSFIFSTALPPLNTAWTLYAMKRIAKMQAQRQWLKQISDYFRQGLEMIVGEKNISTTQIIPWIVGDSQRVVDLSKKMREKGFIALPIRKPTVPAGTERIRFSLSSAIKKNEIDSLLSAIKEII